MKAVDLSEDDPSLNVIDWNQRMLKKLTKSQKSKIEDIQKTETMTHAKRK